VLPPDDFDDEPQASLRVFDGRAGREETLGLDANVGCWFSVHRLSDRLNDASAVEAIRPTKTRSVAQFGD
jgi:hypothetical protein